MKDRTHVEVYDDEAGEVRWRLRADNGRIICEPGQGFADDSQALENLERVEEAFSTLELPIERITSLR